MANSYALLLGAGFLLWPVVAGIPDVYVRYAWIATAVICIAVSSYVVACFLADSQITKPPLPWSFMICAALCVAFYGASVPYLEFSDEILIALPGYTVVHMLIMKTGWIALVMAAWIGLWATRTFATSMTWRTTVIILIAMACFATFVAQSGFTSGIALRYPPLVHLMQIVSSIASGAQPSYYRLPNALWTAILIAVIWTMLPSWSTKAKCITITGMVFGPLGWTYRTVLFQACGEITIGLCAILLLSKLLADEESDRTAALLGITFSAWFLYRPSSLTPILATTALLILLPHTRRSALIIAGVTAPIVACWLFLSPYYTFQYSLGEKVSHGTIALLFKMIAGIMAATRALPTNLSAPVLGILLGSTGIAFLIGTPSHRRLLFSSVFIAVINGFMQNAIINDIYYGVARYNILLLVPLGLSLGVIANAGHSLMARTAWQSIASASALFLILVTPFNFREYTQLLRSESPDIYRTPPEGYLASPLYRATEQMLKTTRSFAIATPGSQYLDLFVAQGMLTAAERSAIMEKSNAWTHATHERPVIVQGPITASYQPNLTPEHEAALREARAWALTQSGITVVREGLEEAIIVP